MLKEEFCSFTFRGVFNSGVLSWIDLLAIALEFCAWEWLVIALMCTVSGSSLIVPERGMRWSH